MSPLTNWVRVDALQAAGRRTPQPWVVLCTSVLMGLLLIGLYRYGARLHLQMPMFKKEGFLENLTFFLEAWASVLCAFAAGRTFNYREETVDAVVAIGYAVCGVLLFLVAMEEISWGQQLVTFQTPEIWREVNRQGETTLHNLASRETLTVAWKVVGVVFFAGVVALVALAQWSKQKLIRFIAPPPVLIPLAALTAYASLRVHPEIAEILIAVFFAFYGYRIYVASPAS